MLLTVIFLISCIITARLLEKKRMKVASIAYSVLFVVLLTALFLTVDIAPISQACINIMGNESYLQTREALIYALRSPGYGTCIYIAVFLTFVLQAATALTLAVTEIVRVLSKEKEICRAGKESSEGYRAFREPDRRKPINLLYCRMLN